MRAFVLAGVLVAACSGSSGPRPRPRPTTVPAHPPIQAIAPAASRRVVPAEAYLRAYLLWFGDLMPRDVERRASPGDLFDTWRDYLAALGLPDYKRDIPRQEQTNALMLATLGRLGEALCVRAAEHDLHAGVPEGQRVVFKFESVHDLDEASFSTRLDVLHRTFLGYPVRLAPSDRVPRFYKLYRGIESRHAGEAEPLRSDEVAWTAVCAALVQHPEAGLY